MQAKRLHRNHPRPTRLSARLIDESNLEPTLIGQEQVVAVTESEAYLESLAEPHLRDVNVRLAVLFDRKPLHDELHRLLPDFWAT